MTSVHDRSDADGARHRGRRGSARRAAADARARRLDPVLREDGRSGLRALHELRPDAVVLDIGLPDLDGWQVLERIRDISDVPVLLLTARNLEVDKVRGLQAGADDYLTKPFGNAELVARVQALLRRASGGRRTTDEVLVDEHSGVRMELRSAPRHGRRRARSTSRRWSGDCCSRSMQHRGQVLVRRAAARAGLERSGRREPASG